MLVELPKIPVRNPLLAGLQCMKCNALFSISFRQGSCPTCRRNNAHIGLHARYSSDEGTPALVNLPYLDGFSLGEGNTPIYNMPELAESLGLSTFEIKDESRNPSGSHKDRMVAMAVNHALDLGVHTIVVGSFGRAAISAALYAYSAGLKCEVASYVPLEHLISKQLREWEAKLHLFKNRVELENFVSLRAERRGYYALTNHQLPEIGSAPMAVDAYKAIAYECLDQVAIPEHVIVPTARGDLAWGIYAGFRDLKKAGLIDRIPQLWVVEPFPRLEMVLQGAKLTDQFPGRTKQFPLSGNRVTFSQWQAVTETGGGAVVVDDYQAATSQRKLKELGIYADLPAAACLEAVNQLRDQRAIRANAFVMMIMTASSEDPVFN
jgi:threonine synthase